MSIIDSLRNANRQRLAKRRGHINQPTTPETTRLTLSSGRSIELAQREVHLSGTGSRMFFYRPDSVGDQGVMKQIFEAKDYDLHH